MKPQSFFDRITRGTNNPLKKNPAPGAHEKNQEAPKNRVDAEQCALDVYETSDELVVRTLIAGVQAEDLDITITHDTLTIRGVRTEELAIPPQNYYYRECYFGPFSRSIILPENTYGDVIKAALKNGILTIRLPKIKKESVAINTN